MNYKAAVLALAVWAGTAAAWNCGHPDNEGGAASVQCDLSSGKFTVSGTGAMADYSSILDRPWNSWSTNIREAVIGEGVTAIGNQAFVNCSNLSSVSISSTVTSISESAIMWYRLSSIEVAADNARYRSVDSVLFTKALDTLIRYAGASQRTSYDIPAGVTVIGYQAFYFCDSLTAVTIPPSVTVIGQSAFSWGSNLASVNIPAGVTFIGERAFQRCQNLATPIEIPAGVTAIENYTFWNCNKLPAVTIPDNVVSIGDYAFASCSTLTSMTIPGSVTTIGNNAFQNCIGLTSLTIPERVTVIGDRAFENNTGLASMTIPDSVTVIGDRAFYGCTGLTSLTIGSSVAVIGEYAFYNCRSLTSVTIPNSVDSVDVRAFSNCDGLTSVTLGDGLTFLGNYAFGDCANLKTIISLNPEPPKASYSILIGMSNAFGGLRAAEITLYVPEGCVHAYNNVTPWKNFGWIRDTSEYVSVDHFPAGKAPRGSLRVSVRGNALYVSMPEQQRTPGTPVQIRMIDVKGRTVLRENLYGNGRISLSHIPAGRYIIDIRRSGVRVWRSSAAVVVR